MKQFNTKEQDEQIILLDYLLVSLLCSLARLVFQGFKRKWGATEPEMEMVAMASGESWKLKTQTQSNKNKTAGKLKWFLPFLHRIWKPKFNLNP